MQPRGLLVLLVVAATALFVVGVRVEQSSGNTHDQPSAAVTEPGSDEGHVDEPGAGGESSEAGETHTGAHAGEASEADQALLGIDLEATAFVALAAAVSLALAVSVWLRPGWGLLLAVVVVAMVAFAALDLREVFHQLDENDGGLALLAGVVAALHLAAAGVALVMGRASSTAAIS